MENGALFLKLIREDFRKNKALADKAIAQIEEKDFSFKPEPESNDLSILIRHMSGNMISRWTDFLTTDGEKPDRFRDREFEDRVLKREELIVIWEKGWKVFLDTLDSLTEDDVQKTVYIRGEAHSVMLALIRQHSHYSYHIGQIVQLAKMIKGKSWQNLSIPKGQSENFKKIK